MNDKTSEKVESVVEEAMDEVSKVVEDIKAEPVVEKTVDVVNSAVDAAQDAVKDATKSKTERTWTEEIEIAGSQLVDQFKSWMSEGNVRKLVLRTPDNSLLIEIPLVAGAVVGGVLTLFATPLAVLAAIASVVAHVKVEVVRVEEQPPKE